MKNFPIHWFKGVFFTIISLLSIGQVSAQSDIISATVLHDAESLVRDFFLAGNCIDVFNFQLSGEVGQAGTFEDGMSSIGIDEGIILSTGNILDVVGPNDNWQTSTPYGNLGNDPDLQVLDTFLVPNPSTHDLSDQVILEFDFTPTADVASFDFVFASEEYCSFIFTSFTDIFGFFVSGPGLSGPYQNNGINIALVPGTNRNISASTINDFVNPAYYRSNTIAVDEDAACSILPPVAPDFIEFDGFTIPLVASFNVIPCETYHVKLAITDTSDDVLDSAVFLKGQSFSAGLTSAISGDIMGESAGENAPYEGCGSADVVFARADLVDTADLVVHYDILATSTAISGVDFTLIPDSVIIPAGTLTDTIHLEFFSDEIIEGNEMFTIKLRNPCSCASSELTITIVDPPPLSGSIDGVDLICDGDPLVLSAIPLGGFGNVSYLWPNNDVDSIYNVVPIETMTHQLVLSDECLQTDTIDFPVTVVSPEIAIDGSGVICDGLPEFSYFLELTGGTSFDFDILQGGMTTSYSDITGDTIWIPTTETGIYQVINASADGCTASTSGFAQALIVDISTAVMIDSINCFEANDGVVAILPSDGDGDYTYTWSHDAMLTQDTAFNLGIGNYDVFISDNQGCLDTVSFSLDQPELFTLEIDTLQLIATCAINGSLEAISQGGTTPYSYSWSNGIMDALNDELAANVYTLTVTDAKMCTEERTVEILSNDDLPTIELFLDDSLDCLVEMVNITTANSTSGPEFTYIWTNSAGDTLVIADPQNWTTAIPDTYTLEIRNTTSDCSSSQSIVVTEDIAPPPANIQTSLINLDCYQPNALLSAEQVSQDWIPVWSDLDADTLIVSGEWNIDISNGGDFELFVTNTINGCEARDTIHINQSFNGPVATIPTPDSLTCTASEVDLFVDISIGSGSYTYQWSGPLGGIIGVNNEDSVTVNMEGTYEVALFDTFNGCSDTVSTNVIIDVSSLVINPLPDSTLTCTVTDISFVASSPNTGNLEYSWVDDDEMILSNTADVLITEIGSYTVNVIDIDNNCNQSTTIVIDEDLTEPIIMTNTPDELDCDTDNVDLSVVSNTDQSAMWMDIDGDVLAQNTWVYTATSTGEYQVLVTNDGNGCSSLDTIMVMIDTIPPQATISVPGDLTCEITDINLEGNPTSGSGDYSYSWTGPTGGINGSTSQMTVNVSNPGIYFLDLTDNDNGCTTQVSAEVFRDGDFPEINPIQDTLINCYNPTITITASTPTIGNLSFQWLNEDDITLSSTAELIASEEGIYTVELINNTNNCVSSLSIIVTEDFAEPVANAGPDVEIDCQIDNAVLVAPQGESHLIPSWFDASNILLSTGEWTYSTNVEGVYELVLFNNLNGCEGADLAEITIDQDTPTANAGLDVDIDCFSNTATIDASASTQGQNITYSLFDSNGGLVQEGNSDIFAVDQVGQYQLVVTNNDNNCFDEDVVLVDIDIPEVTEISTINAFCFGQEGSIIIEMVEGGVPPYLYSIDGGLTYQVSNIFSGLEAGVYDVAIQDMNSCIGESIAILEQPEEMILILPEIIELSFGDSAIIDSKINRLDTTGLSFQWSNSDQLSCLDCFRPQFNATESQQLELTVTDENGCTATAIVSIIVDERIPVYIPNVFSPNNEDGTNDRFIIFGKASQVVQVNYINIFDRWGNLVYTAKEFPVNAPSFGWDGRRNGEKLNPGVFVYTTEVKLITGKDVHLKGEVLLLE